MKKVLPSLLLTLAWTLSINAQQLPLLDTYVNQLTAGEKSSGTLCIAHNGKTIYAKSVGWADRENNRPIDLETKFLIASVAKPFTASAMLLLARDGTIELSDPISRYLPELEAYQDVTITQLLNHTSGISGLYGEGTILEQPSAEQVKTNRDLVAFLAEQERFKDFEPGAKYAYSNTNYVLLASIMEAVTGQSFQEWMNKHLFLPLGLDDTGIISLQRSRLGLENSAVGYVYSDSLQAILPADEAPETSELLASNAGLLGQGSMYSTVKDLVRWTQHTQGDFFTKAEKALIFYPEPSGERLTYSYGWDIEVDEEFGRIAQHSGRWGGWNSNLEHQMEHHITIVYLSNLEGADYEYPDFQKIRQIVAGTYYDLNDTNLPRYTGKYETVEGKTDELIARDGRLYKKYRSLELELVPRSKTRFELKGFAPTVTYVFEFGDDDTVVGSRMTQAETGVDVKYRKLPEE
ncbi:beta-lactamase family protein [Flavobacteriaceae bacterium TP-CH-4]|uniref:Beta-lactamase family protein n=1 Tax=Pelagihabitans pacificus TaxID=2696054 RepID=A0A967E950_9FLAO|nr:serine hydrolase domain-containing protein [Pelagihabitans pacificus]NHF58126.1 beta-lactamase family protein [Pelagihabitans pacificus]